MGKKQSEAGYYAVIPADVRYSKVSANAKLLYGEITALCHKEGYCWASNKYFAELYGSHERSVSRWVSELVDAGFVSVEITDMTLRKIVVGGRQKREGGTTKMSRGVRQNREHNTTENSTSNTTKNIPQECYALADLLYENIMERYPNNKIASNYRETWGAEIDRMVRLDGRQYEGIRSVILWAFKISDFWHRQIWSGSNLRKHYDKMFAQAENDMGKLKEQRKKQLSHALSMDKISLEQYKAELAKL